MILVSMTSLASVPLTWLLLASPCLVWALVREPVTMLTATNTAKPGCQHKCGNLTIPYPYGIGKRCSLGESYILTCNTENNSYITRMLYSKTPILDISETQLTTAAPRPMAASCNSTEMGNDWRGLDLTGTPFALSSTGNKFVVTGCHHYGMIEAETRVGREVFSCVSLCTKANDLLIGTCSGIGCCQAPIPKGLQNFNVSLEKIYYNTSISSGNCSYAFILKQSSFNFRGAIDLQDPDFSLRMKHVPVVIDWFIPNEVCRDAKQNSVTYACQQYTSCIDLDQLLNVNGYRCKCLHGYEGNPYLSPGCTDINECTGPSNPCSHICVNTPGSYYCYCPTGYHGDGRKDGTGCLARSVKLFFIVGFGVGLGCILFLLGGFWLFVLARRRKEIMQRATNFKRNGGLLLQQQMSSEEGMIEKTRIFTSDELQKATDNFNEDRVLGQGGQGTVYKGMLSDGIIVAIKKSKITSPNQLGQFINEVVLLTQINHRNIVKLLGCCLETEVPLLVYEFVPNGTLCKYIHNSGEDFPITWEMRLQIAIDVAGACTYLHSALSKPIFHRDIKSSNILLDAKYRAKLSDFGTSRSVDIDQTHITTCVQGTFGYLDPEYFQTHQFTEKSDVYSFGVVLLELLTGEKAILPSESFSGKSLVSWFLSTMERSDLYNLLATRVANEGRKETVIAVAHLAKRCLNMDGRQRPTMREAALELEVISQSHHVPESTQENLPETKIIDETSTEITVSKADIPCTFYTEEDYSLP